MIRYVFLFVMLIDLRGFCQQQLNVTLSNSPGKVTPGKHFTLFFDVQSAGALPAVMEGKILLPQKWNLLSQRNPEPTEGQHKRRYFFVISTPSDCSAGNYVLNFELTAENRRIVTPVSIAIEQIRKVEVFVVSKPEFVKEGDTLRVEYLIQNAGNNTEKLALTSEHGMIEQVKDSLTLEPNAKFSVTVSQVIPFTDNNSWQSSSELTVKMTDNQAPVYNIVPVPVFSSKIRKIDPYFRFPVEIGGGYLTYRYGNRTLAAYQYTATGAGFLDQKSKHYVDFTVRGPNQFVFPAVGSYDQYSLSYQYNKKTLVSVGDYILQLNNLLEFGRFGRGAKLEQQFGKTGYTVFYQKARFYLNQKESYGGKFTFDPGESVRLSLSYASKNVMYHNRQFWSDLLGLSANIRTKSMQLETEVASGKALGHTDYGLFLKFSLVKKWLNLSSNLIYAGKDFYGFYNNSRLLNNNIGFTITKGLVIGVSTNFSNVNPGLDATYYNASPKESSYMAYASYQLNARNRFFIFYSKQERKDRQMPASFHYEESFANMTYHYQYERLTLTYQGRYGFSRNLLIADNTGKKQSYSNLAQPTVRMFSWLWAGGYLEHQHTSKFSASNVIENLFFYGGNARINLKRNLSASFMYRNNYAPDELFERRSFLDAALMLDLKRHVFTVTGGRSYVPNMENRDQNTLFLTVKYALNLNVPLSRKKNIGKVTGKLTGTGFSKQGNLIQLGSHKFLTDSTGRFAFEGVAPDRYYLSITQNSSRNEGVIADIKVPMLVEVKADSAQVIEIPLTRTGNIAGKVEFETGNHSKMTAVLAQKPTVLVKLFNDTDSFLTEANERGAFTFKEIKPGKWHVNAFIPGTQERFVIEESSKQLDLEIDQTMNVEFKVKPNEKRIHFSEKRFEVSVKK